MATHIKSILNDFLKETKKINKEKEKIQAIIDKVLDEKIRIHVYLKKTDKKKLVFQSDSSIYSYELNLRKNELLKEIQKEYPLIEKIQVIAG